MIDTLVIKAERAGLGWHCDCIGKFGSGKSLSEALQKVVSQLNRIPRHHGRNWSCPEAGMRGVVGPLRKRSRAEAPQLALVGGKMNQE